jgi:hypothetical protein
MVFSVPLTELTEFEFIKLLQLNLKLDTTYTILFQYTLYEQNNHLMLGPQVGIIVKETHDLEYYRNLYEHFSEILEITTQRYNVESPDFIIIYLKELILEETLKKEDPISQIVLSKALIKVGDTKKKFGSYILPLTYNEKYFGALLQDNLKIEYLNKLIEKLNKSIKEHNSAVRSSAAVQSTGGAGAVGAAVQSTGVASADFFNACAGAADFNNLITGLNTAQNQIIFLQKVISASSNCNSLLRTDKGQEGVATQKYATDLFKVYLSNSKYLIISIMSPDFVYYRIVFDNKTGKLLFVSRDILNPQLINKSNFILNPTKT